MSTILGIMGAAGVTAIIALLIAIYRRVDGCQHRDISDIFERERRNQARLDRRTK